MRQFVQQAVCLLAIMLLAANTASAQSFTRPSATSVDFTCADGKHYILDFYGPNIVRLFSDPAGGQMRQPEATPPAEILVKNPRRDVGTISVSEVAGGYWAAQTTKMKVKVRKADGIIVLYDAEGHHLVTQMEPTLFEPARTSVVLSCKPSEYFFGGGVQNGRFSHRGRVIAIENTNNWVDGGVTSPAPFFWSTGGYAIMPYTFRPGKYDFGATNTAQVRLTHDTSYLDLFLMVNQGCVPLLRDYYQLTGNPVLLPKFGFYEGHLNAYTKTIGLRNPPLKRRPQMPTCPPYPPLHTMLPWVGSWAPMAPFSLRTGYVTRSRRLTTAAYARALMVNLKAATSSLHAPS